MDSSSGIFAIIAAAVTAVVLIALLIVSWSVCLVAIAAYFTPMLPFWAWVVILVLTCIIISLLKFLVKAI